MKIAQAKNANCDVRISFKEWHRDRAAAFVFAKYVYYDGLCCSEIYF